MATEILLILILVAFIAGFVDAIGGGGGLLTMPALLWAGIAPVPALATNKLQSSWGTAAATINYARKGHLQWRAVWPVVLLTFLGSAIGTVAVQQFDGDFLMRVIPFLLIGVALYFLLQPRIGDLDRQQRLSVWQFAFICGFGIGFYDGFFGPGTGSFFAIACVSLLGFNLLRATAHTKLFNLTSNLASLLFFALGGHMIWQVGLLMAIGQVAGGWLGAQVTIRHGARIIRPVVIVVALALTLRLLLQGN